MANGSNQTSLKKASDYYIYFDRISEKEKLDLAKMTLLGVVILWLLGGFALAFKTPHGMDIFDACKTILPPIATLILGYYFSEKSKR